MSPGQTGHITGQMGRVPGTDGTHTRGCPAKILYVYWSFFLSQKCSKFGELIILKTIRFDTLKEGKSAINLSNLRDFCQIWPQVIYLC